MKPELDRIKNDLDTIQKAMGLAPSLGREWLEWMKRDQWFSLWWCLPGCILIAAEFVDRSHPYWGLLAGQWAGILVAATMLAIAAVHSRRMVRTDHLSHGAAREAKRLAGLDSQGLRFGLMLLAQLGAYFIWAWQHHVAFEPFWSGLFVLMGSTCLTVALSADAWTLLGWGIPFLAYGLGFSMVHGKWRGALFGMMFIAIALCFSVVQTWQIRKFQQEHAAD